MTPLRDRFSGGGSSLTPFEIHEGTGLQDKERRPDEELVRSCLEGDSDAWSELIDRYRNLIFSIPVKHNFSPEDAAEVFQEVCLKLLGALPHLRQPQALAAWLIRVASRECMQWRKKNLRYYSLKADDHCLRSEAFELTRNIITDVQSEQALRDAVGELKGRCRELVEMLFFTLPAVPYEQVAKRLGLAKGSIGFIRMRCLGSLRKLLDQKGFGI
jgi:RNA polymerase sigma factor (sigma-70 family)